MIATIRTGFVALTLAAALAGVTGARALTAAQTLKFGDWLAQCHADDKATQNCVLRQLLIDDRGRKVLSLTISRKGSGLAIEADGPLGLSIPFGLSLQIDTEKVPLQLLSCSMQGCLAVSRLDEESLRQLIAARAIAVVFKDFVSDKVLSISVSPVGLGQGIALIRAL
jgi:invasion protein IalB